MTHLAFSSSFTVRRSRLQMSVECLTRDLNHLRIRACLRLGLSCQSPALHVVSSSFGARRCRPQRSVQGITRQFNHRRLDFPFRVLQDGCQEHCRRSALSPAVACTRFRTCIWSPHCLSSSSPALHAFRSTCSVRHLRLSTVCLHSSSALCDCTSRICPLQRSAFSPRDVY